MGNDTDLRVWFGLKRTPFSPDLKPEQLFLRPCMEEIRQRLTFAVRSSLYFAIIGDVGAGKSTALRYALSQLPDKQFAVLPVICVWSSKKG